MLCWRIGHPPTVRPRSSNLIRGRDATHIRHGSRQGRATRKTQLDPFHPNNAPGIFGILKRQNTTVSGFKASIVTIPNIARVGLVCVTSSGKSGLKLVGSKRGQKLPMVIAGSKAEQGVQQRRSAGRAQLTPNPRKGHNGRTFPS